MDNILISKEQLRKNACWQDKDTFITTIQFSDFSIDLTKALSYIIEPNDITDGGYLCCEYWADEECFAYNLNFEYDSVPINDYFNKPLYNDMIKDIAKEIQNDKS